MATVEETERFKAQEEQFSHNRALVSVQNLTEVLMQNDACAHERLRGHSFKFFTTVPANKIKDGGRKPYRNAGLFTTINRTNAFSQPQSKPQVNHLNCFSPLNNPPAALGFDGVPLSVGFMEDTLKGFFSLFLEGECVKIIPSENRILRMQSTNPHTQGRCQAFL